MRIIGHRGAAAVAPENTLAGVTAAFDAGAAGIEVDVRRTADGLLVCSHDPDLGRLGGPAVPLVTLVTADLASVRLAGGEPVATVEAVLDAATGRGRVVLEVKNVPGEPDFDAPAERTAALLADLLVRRRAGGHADDVVVSSFDWFAVEVARAAGLRTGFLTPPGLLLGAAVAYAAEAGHAECHPHASSVDAAGVAAAHAAGVAVVCWTVDEPEEADGLAALGVDAVITNDPARLLRRRP